MRSSLVVRNIYSKQPKEKLGYKEQVNFVKYSILNRAQKRAIVNVSKGNTVYIMLLSIEFCVDARCSATGTSRSAVFFCLGSETIIAWHGESVNYILCLLLLIAQYIVFTRCFRLSRSDQTVMAPRNFLLVRGDR